MFDLAEIVLYIVIRRHSNVSCSHLCTMCSQTAMPSLTLSVCYAPPSLALPVCYML